MCSKNYPYVEGGRRRITDPGMGQIISPKKPILDDMQTQVSMLFYLLPEHHGREPVLRHDEK